jgi:AraC-like DNA-binding protein
MRCDEFGTGNLPTHMQLEAWQSWYAHVFETSSLEPGDHGFDACNRNWNLGGLALSHVSAPGVSVLRTKTLIRREPVDHWAITLGTRRGTYLNSEGRSLDAPAGLPFVLSLGQEMLNRRQADERVQLYLSRDSFHSIAHLLDASCLTCLQPPGGRLLADYMRLLLHNVPSLNDDDAPRLVDTTRAMIAACLAPAGNRIAEARPPIKATLMERVRQTVRRHLRSPDLGPGLICRDAATSRSQLYRLLEGEGGVAHYIRKLRLLEAFSLLCDGPQNLTISEIAEALCFADSSSFARAFRREFGSSPKDIRVAARAGLSPVPIPQPADRLTTRSFVSCLRS